MKQLFVALFFSLICFSGYSQKKKYLLNEISELKSSIKKEQEKVSQLKSLNKTTLSKLDFSNNQIEDLKTENAELLKTINNFTSVSIQKTENVENSLKTIKEKDEQLKVIKDALTNAENNRLSEIQFFKSKLNTIGKIEIKNNQLVMSIPNSNLFTITGTSSYTLSEQGKNNLLKIGAVLNEKPSYKIIIESNNRVSKLINNNTISNWDWDLSTKRATSVILNLQNASKINPKRLAIISKGDDSNGDTLKSEPTTHIIIDAEFDSFFSLIKNRMKK